MPVYSTVGCKVEYTAAGVGGAAGAYTQLLGWSEGTLTFTMETVDVTKVGDTDRALTYGIRSGGFTGTIIYDPANHKYLETLVSSGVANTWRWTTIPAAGAGTVANTYVASSMITDFAVTIASAEVVRANITVKFVGAVAFSA
jgi:Phage tail tube protein